jgi:hypothetical protein
MDANLRREDTQILLSHEESLTIRDNGRSFLGVMQGLSDGPSSETDKYQSLVKRFDERASQLRWQANLLLVIIIAVLVAGTVAFIFANYIANLNLHPQTAENQYAARITRMPVNAEDCSFPNMIRSRRSFAECKISCEIAMMPLANFVQVSRPNYFR